MTAQDGLFPLSSSDIHTAFAVFLATVFASAAGIGGGAVLVGAASFSEGPEAARGHVTAVAFNQGVGGEDTQPISVELL